MIERKITIIHTSAPVNVTINDKLQWLGGSLGLFNLRDKDKSCFRMFITLIKASQQGAMTTDDFANQLGLTRATVLHHLRKLEEAGLVKHTEQGYFMQEKSLQKLVDHLESDFLDTLKTMKTVAKQIDQQLGLDE